LLVVAVVELNTQAEAVLAVIVPRLAQKILVVVHLPKAE
tara:strand:+ start:102 stop:218 length:117 start_codon:yes stop_codon:yes gene_type:complete